MRRTNTFLTNGDERDFNAPGRCFYRWVENVTPTEATKASRKRERVGLRAEIEADLWQRFRKSTRWAHAVSVEVHENDGMTWSAEIVRSCLAAKYPKLPIACIRNAQGAGPLPAIAEIVGDRTFMRRAVSFGLADPYPTLMSWRAAALVTLTVILSMSAPIVDALAKHLSEQWKSGVPRPGLLALIAMGAMLTIVLQWILGNHPVLSFRKSKENFGKLGDEELCRKREYPDFIEWLARHLSTSGSKIVIIDNYGALDELSHSVLGRYFEELHSSVEHCHYWILFEGERGETFTAKALAGWNSTRFLRPTLYRQEYLSPDDRQRLARLIAQPARAAFHAVKSICRPAEVDDEWIRNVLEPCLSRHANPLTLRYIYLLSLAATDLAPEHRERDSCSCLYFSWDFLSEVTGQRDSSVIALDGLSRESTGIRGRVLTAMFGQTLNRSDLESIHRDVKLYMAPLLSAGRGSAFCVTREVATYLAAHCSELDLPDPSAGKLYWTFVIAQKRNARRAFWARYLIHQILEIDVGRLPESLRYGDGLVLRELRNLSTQMCEAAVRSCLFAELPELIRMTRVLFSEETDSAAAQRSLLRAAWQAYHVTSDEEVLREIVGTYLSRGHLQPVSVRMTNVERTFSQSLTLAPELRAMLEQLLLGPDARVDSPDARDYALARGCWVILAGAPFFTRSSINPASFRLFDTTGVPETIGGVVEQTLIRLAAADAETSTLDIAALSMAVWCKALALNPLMIDALGRTATADAIYVGGEGPYRHFALVSAHLAEMDRLLSAAQLAVTAAGTYMKAARASSTSNLLNSAMMTDTCAVALAAVYLGRHYLTQFVVPTPGLELRVRELVADVDDVLGTSLEAESAIGERLREKISDLLHISAMVWNRFGLDRMSEMATLRYVQFTFTAGRVHVHEETRQQPLLAAVEPLIREPHFSGIAANLVLASAFSESAELMAIHLTHAVVLAGEALFGDDLKTSLALAAALNAGVIREEMSEVVEPLLAPDASGETVVSAFVTVVDEEHVEAAALHLLNAARVAEGADDTLRRMIAAIRLGLGRRAASTARDNASALLDFTLTEMTLDLRNADVPQLLNSWQSKKDLWMYPSLLLMLRRAGVSNGSILEEALLALQRNPALDQMNTWYHLALDVATDLIDENAEDVAASYVREAVERWERHETADFNMNAYGLLLRRAPNNAAYIRGLARSQQVKIKRDRSRKLPLLAAEGKFFLIFADYVAHMHVWGLPFDMPSGEYFALLRQSELDRSNYVERWIASGRVVPEPTVIRGRFLSVSGAFLVLGHHLFSEPFLSNVALQGERHQLNVKARGALPTVVHSIESLQSIPPETRRVLHDYGAEYSAPMEPQVSQ